VADNLVNDKPPGWAGKQPVGPHLIWGEQGLDVINYGVVLEYLQDHRPGRVEMAKKQVSDIQKRKPIPFSSQTPPTLHHIHRGQIAVVPGSIPNRSRPAVEPSFQAEILAAS
jgi:hypothetical protein